MDIVEFAEKVIGTELHEWQKEYLQLLYKVSRDQPVYIIMRPHQGREVFYTYFKQYILKELTKNATTLDSY